MSENIQNLKTSADYLAAARANKHDDHRALYEQALICLDAKELALFLHEIKDIANLDYGEDAFYQALRTCVGTQYNGSIPEQKILDICTELSSMLDMEKVIVHIVGIIRNRYEQLTVNDAIGTKKLNARTDVLRTLIQPMEERDDGMRTHLEPWLKALYEVRGQLASEANDDNPVPQEVGILNHLIKMPKGDLFEIVQLGGSRKTDVVIKRLTDFDTFSLAEDFLGAEDKKRIGLRTKLMKILSA